MRELAPTCKEIFAELRRLLEVGDDEQLRAFLADQHSSDVADCLELLEPEERSQVLFLLPPRIMAETVVALEEAVRSDVLEDMSQQQVTEVLMELPSDDAADILGDLEKEEAEKIFEQLPADQQAEVEPLRYYEENTAGGIMSTELVSLNQNATVSDAIETIRQLTPDETQEIFYIFCVDNQNCLQGILPSIRLVTARPTTPVKNLLLRETYAVNVNDDQEIVKGQFEKYDVAALPVVDEQNQLLGVITHDDILDVAKEEAEEDLLHMGGTDAEEFSTSSIIHAATVRARWLIPCLMGTFVASMIMFLLKPHLGFLSAIVIPFILPIAAMGGNAGVQTSTVMVRSLAIGEPFGARLQTALFREFRITLLLGISSGILASLGSMVILYFDVLTASDQAAPFLHIGLAVGLSMALAILVSTTLGMLLPFLFHRIGIDPAIATGPLITTFNDAVSTAIYMLISIFLLTSIVQGLDSRQPIEDENPQSTAVSVIKFASQEIPFTLAK
jgi:magnesium transporter